MKKIFYSPIAKLLAFIICAVSFGSCAYTAVSSFVGSRMVYMFEDSYLSSRALANPLESSLRSLVMTIYNGVAPEDMDAALGRMKTSLDGWDYYINRNGAVYANTENVSYDVFERSDAAMGIKFDGTDIDGFSNSAADLIYTAGLMDYIYFGGYSGDEDSAQTRNAEPFEVCVRMSSAALEENTAAWNKLRQNAVSGLNGMCVLLILSAAAFVYLLFVTGRDYKSEEIRLVTIDRIFVEINLALMACIGAGGIILGAYIVSLIYEGMNGINAFIFPLGAAWAALMLVLVLSIVRNVKNRTFLERSLTVRVIKFLWRIALKIVRFILRAVKRIFAALRGWFAAAARCLEKNFSQRKAAALFLGYSVVLMILSLSMLTVVMIPVVLIFIAAAVIYVFRRLEGFDKIIAGVAEIRGGDIEHKIEGCPAGVMSELAENVNSIGDGLKQSLDREVRAERMKSELITNVSHDLKTPLTSIISYADLLDAETLSPPEANDYVKIIKQKGERLKALTEDLFEVSKAQSGSSEFNIEDIDICLLINQTLAELDESISKSGLEFVSELRENEMFVSGDGKKLSRVFENLIGNCLKYSMKGTRVYINVCREDGMIRAEIKNIAAYRMDFDTEEITERFVRGDRSRSSEGSGLGLAIVKSYVEGCSGQFRAVVDGDLFKAVVLLKAAGESPKV